MSDVDGSDPAARAGRTPEMTVAAIVLGVVLSVVMGAANVYLGLKAGMTVSASIPAAVISLGILRGVMRRSSVLESNLVQTAASAGESLAAGIIFTMPALLLTGIWDDFDFWTTSLVALSGGLLGILLMIPMRKVFVVDDPELKFPEGVACAEVLRAGGAETSTETQSQQSGLGLILGGIAVGGVFKFLQSFVGLFRDAAEAAAVGSGRVFYAGTSVSPALFAVGYIVTLPIAVQIFAGGFLGWMVCLPLLGTAGLEETGSVAMAYEIWSEEVRYMGVGAMIVGGIASIWRVRAGLLAAVRQLLDALAKRPAQAEVDPTERNMSGRAIIALGVFCILLVAGIYYELLGSDVGLTLLTTAVMLVMSFFFAAVASYIVGLVGNSNSPVSGMTITAVLGTAAMMWLFGFSGTHAIVATLGVAGVVCCVACTSGDVCNDLKTGYLVGASPRHQQVMQILGVVVAAFVMAPVMTVLHEGSLNAGTGGIGGRELPAPQAGLFASLTTGFFSEQGDLPEHMVAWGVGIGVLLLVADRLLAKAGSSVRLHVMPVAVGIYLPFLLSVPILLGGIVRHLVNRRSPKGDDENARRGVLVSSGLIAGESLIGVLLGLLAYLNVKFLTVGNRLASLFGLSETGQDAALQLISVAALAAVAIWVYAQAARRG